MKLTILLRLKVEQVVAFEHKPPFFEDFTVQAFLVQTALSLVHVYEE